MKGFFALLAVALTICCMSLNVMACSASPRTSPVNDGNPGIPGIEGMIASLTPYTFQAGCSEVVEVFSMEAFHSEDFTWPRENCPHLGAAASNVLPALSEGQSIEITSPTLLSACSVASGAVVDRITVRSGGSLVFDDADLTLRVREIWVDAGGELLIGSPDCRLYSEINIVFHGNRGDSNNANFNYAGGPSKGIQSYGNVDIHGKEFRPTWSRLSRTANAGDDVIYIQDPINWEVGQEVVVTTSIYFDCPFEWEEFCKPCYPWEDCEAVSHQNEVRVIKGIYVDTVNEEYAIQFTEALVHNHWSGPEYQVEVGLLSRKIKLMGEQSNDNYGGHTLVTEGGRGRFSGVQADNMGQLNGNGRYPFHLHLVEEEPGRNSYFKDVSITNSQFRCIVIHGTNEVDLHSNVAYNIKGMCYYLEDGVEERNSLRYNLAAHVHPINTPANGGYGQGGEQFVEGPNLFLPADTSASGYYVPNAYNEFIGNAASGGWSGFAFPNTPKPLGVFKDTDLGENMDPWNRPTLVFKGNTAHSAGFYWEGHGSCIYTGARLYYEGNTLNYNSGRYDRRTKFSNGTSAWMKFEDTKTFLCNKGIAHWGSEIEITNFENYDSGVAAMLFGETGIHNGLIVGRTANEAGWEQFDLSSYSQKMGFQFYDTWVKTILSKVTFRSYTANPTKKTEPDYAIRYMDHSDQFTPQGINSVQGIKFEDVDVSISSGIKQCGADCGPGEHATMSSKIYAVSDYDGTMGMRNSPSILGSNRKWWVYDDSSCELQSDWHIWRCDWKERMNVGYMYFEIPGLVESNLCVEHCRGQNAFYTVANFQQWGKSSEYGIGISPYPGVSGISNIGWHVRPKVEAAEGDDGAIPNVYGGSGNPLEGAPSRFTINSVQLPRENFIVLSMTYPSNTEFTVRIRYPGWGLDDTLPMSEKSVVLTPREDMLDVGSMDCSDGEWFEMCDVANTGGVGPAWHFDGTNLYLRVVQIGCYNNNFYDECPTRFYEFNGVRVNSISHGFRYEIDANCPGCATQSSHNGIDYYRVTDSVPPAWQSDFGPTRQSSGVTPGHDSRYWSLDSFDPENKICRPRRKAMSSSTGATGASGSVSVTGSPVSSSAHLVVASLFIILSIFIST